MKYANNILDIIGNTPFVRINALSKDIKCTILAKLEYLNPGGSTKDRIGIAMIEDAEKKGLLKKGGTIVEPTSGNTGVGIAIAAIAKGYKTIFTMPEKMSRDKELILKAYGAKVIRTPNTTPDNPNHYINVAKKIALETKNSYMPNQYDNKVNSNAHYRSTGPEIWKDTNGKITHFVATVGTGGTITGTAKYLKEKNPKIKVIGADAEGSLLNNYFYHTEGEAHSYKVEGPGEDFMPGALDFKYIDDIIIVTDKQSFLTARKLVREEGIFAGGSSGMAVFLSLKIAKTLPKKAVVATILPDSGRNYISKFYDNEWMTKNKFI